MAKIVNLTVLKLEHIVEQFPSNNCYAGLFTLDISGSTFSVEQLNDFLQKTPKLKTIKISHCNILPKEFMQLSFSMLPNLEHVSLIGHIAPNVHALTHVINTVSKSVKWTVENSNLASGEISEQLKAGIEQRRIVIKEPIRKLPPNRYVPQSSKTDINSIISADWHSGLINCSDPRALRVALEEHCKATHRLFFYVNHPDELRCASHYIDRDSAIGVIKKGPGGALYDFLQENNQAVMVINYDNFRPSDIARFNSVLDEERLVDGVPIPKGFKIIGVINTSKRSTYQGADFYSRFEQHEDFDVALPPVPQVEFTHEIKDTSLEHQIIELNGGTDWQARLVGSWLLEGHELRFQYGLLIAALKQGRTKITINNPPQNNPEFERFLDDMYIHKGIFHQGKLEQDLPVNFHLNMTQFISFPDKDDYVTFNQRPTDASDYIILNQVTSSDFLGRYQSDTRTRGLSLKPGYLEQCNKQYVNIYLTETLSPHAWLSLLEAAKKYQTRLNISLAPNIELPEALSPSYAVERLKLASKAHTTLYVCNDPWAVEYPKQALVIDVSELNAYDLLPSLESQFDEVRLAFNFSEKTGFLTKALADNKTVVLKGTWPDNLARSLEPLINERLKTTSCSGKLILVSDNDSTFTFMEESPQPLHPILPNIPTSLNADFEERFDMVNDVLSKQPFLFLSGATGVGKTRFIETIWIAHHPKCFYGVDHMTKWLECNSEDSRFITLFIDEANITSRQWSEFEGLFNHPPSIFYNGQYHELTSKHKVIFAGNPFGYGGERQKPAFFEHHGGIVNFNPIPMNVIKNLLDLEGAALQPILNVYDYITTLDSKDTLITPREIIMIACLTKTLMIDYNDLALETITKYLAYTLSQHHVPKQYKIAFDTKFKPKKTPQFERLKFNTFIANESNQSTIEALMHHLALRNKRQSNNPNIPATGGLGGLVIEGEPGLGKSALVLELLTAKGLKEQQDFYRIPASLSSQDKEDILLKAFYGGKIAIIDEINSSPMLERLLNALLEGHDLNGNPPRYKGFLLVGTQNPTTFRGRVHTTQPLAHRLQTIVISPYTDKEKEEILRHIGLPYRVRNDMITEFNQRQKKDSKLCFRDLLKYAKNWDKCNHGRNSPSLELTPQPQVGEICKLVSIANIENYYAEKLDFEPMQLRANKSGKLSIRRIAKQNGSIQGEVLEFDTWRKNLTDIGYDTDVVDFKDNINLFVSGIEKSLINGDLPMLAFSVEKSTGHPDAAPFSAEKTEHAAVITSYDPESDTVSLAYWGRTHIVDVVTLFNSAQALLPTRGSEYYKKNIAYTSENKSYTPKYVAADGQDKMATITPKENSGFQSKMLVVKKPKKVCLLQYRSLLKNQPTDEFDQLQDPRNRKSSWEDDDLVTSYSYEGRFFKKEGGSCNDRKRSPNYRPALNCSIL
ncbi:MAG: hypothetical protein COB66_09460 [Coxiella sp. (in: Bacteria)]|nr:MAG: hypothetical protein COB66_09460 [Coxiella sp. (in: g-proteobacteria)]